jgi:glyoxylase-like metal-dependent hydrolase (beta-lactamase superfamily II)
MKRIVSSIALLFFIYITSIAQLPVSQIKGEVVYEGDDVVFRQIDEHTWVGTGKKMFNESLYLVEGQEKAILIDAGTNIKDLNKIVSSITKKPYKVVATHVHPDHTGSSIDAFPEISINPGDTVLIPQFMPNYKGVVKFLKDGEKIDLGGRELEVVYTPAHTPGSTTFIDKNAGYGFSGDSFGSGNLLLTLDFSTLISTCEKTSALMEKYGIKILYPGHYFGGNEETKKRVNDMIILSKAVLSGKVKGQENTKGWPGLNLIVNDFGVKINFNEKSIK